MGSPMLIGVDTGGTFTDLVAIAPDGQVFTHKVLSTPTDPGAAVVKGVTELLAIATSADEQPTEIAVVHGSTVATNALLERAGATTAFVTTAGFGDMLHIGRQARRELYNLTPSVQTPIISSERCIEVDERVGANGEVVQLLDAAEVERVATAVQSLGVQSVAVCLLFSYIRPEHEEQIATALRQKGFSVSVSHEIVPEHREYERAATTVLNAYVAPLMTGYLGKLDQSLRALGSRELRVMQSSGGSISADEAGRFAAHTLLSGPAGGAVGALASAQQSGFDQVIGLDMGGTSTDVSLLPGRIPVTMRAEIGGMPLRLPVIDIHTVGAGGGSIAYVDGGGALRVGPRSAGANPGPACYGLGGTEPTVTDANVVLGRIPPGRFLGGRMPLDMQAARAAMAHLAKRLGAGVTVEQAAQGIIDVVNSNMERAVRVISVERGHDPRDFTLVSFGGAGSLHACDLARALGIPRVLIPQNPGVLSAFGMAVADIVKTYSQGLLRRFDGQAVQDAQAIAAQLVERGKTDLLAQGCTPEAIQLEISLDMRYIGQSFELSVAVPASDTPWNAPKMVEQFHEAHANEYGYSSLREGVELVAVRLRATATPAGRPAKLGMAPALDVEVPPERENTEEADLAALKGLQLPVVDRYDIKPGDTLQGPLVVAEGFATIYVGSEDKVEALGSGALLITVG